MKRVFYFTNVIMVTVMLFSCKSEVSEKNKSTEPVQKQMAETDKNGFRENTDTLIDKPAASEITGTVKDDTGKNTKNEAKQQEILPKTPENEKPAVRPAPAPEKPEMLADARVKVNKDNPQTVKENVRVVADVRLYQSLLKKYVSNTGKVNYAALKKDIDNLETYTLVLSDDPGFEKGTDKEKLALWINTYNAYTLLMVARNYPMNSIRDIHGGKPWDAVWIRIGKKNYSLNQIENDIIRPLFSEPRIHFVLNCAATSCPPLLNTAFTSENLENLMETASKNFINSRHNVIRENKAEISSIFDWYREDFGNVIQFLNRYSNVKLKENAKLTYLKYDWSLND